MHTYDVATNSRVTRAGPWHSTPTTLYPFTINLVAGHKPGYANASVVHTLTNKVVVALKAWGHRPDVTDGSTYDERTNFNVILLSGLGSVCGTVGKYVI